MDVLMKFRSSLSACYFHYINLVFGMILPTYMIASDLFKVAACIITCLVLRLGMNMNAL